MLGMANKDCSFITLCTFVETQSLLSLINEQVFCYKKNNTLISTVFMVHSLYSLVHTLKMVLLLL